MRDVRDQAGVSTPNGVITQEKFCALFPTLVLGQRVPPKKPESVHVLLISAAIAFDFRREYSEPDVNALLQQWVDAFGEGCGLDRVTMRRLLIDEGYLRRDTFGKKYTANRRGYRFRYDPMIRMLDLHGLVEKAQVEREDRRMARGRGPS